MNENCKLIYKVFGNTFWIYSFGILKGKIFNRNLLKNKHEF